MMLNQFGANIQYPYHDLPIVSTKDRLGYLAMLGVLEQLQEGMTGDGMTLDGKKGVKITLDCGKPPKDRRK